MLFKFRLQLSGTEQGAAGCSTGWGAAAFFLNVPRHSESPWSTLHVPGFHWKTGAPSAVPEAAGPRILWAALWGGLTSYLQRVEPGEAATVGAEPNLCW